MIKFIVQTVIQTMPTSRPSIGVIVTAKFTLQARLHQRLI